MTAIEKCPLCGGCLTSKRVEKLVRGGEDTAVLKVEADVCMRCGERLYSEDTVRLFERIRTKLEQHDTSGLELIGRSFSVA